MKQQKVINSRQHESHRKVRTFDSTPLLFKSSSRETKKSESKRRLLVNKEATTGCNKLLINSGSENLKESDHRSFEINENWFSIIQKKPGIN